MLDVDIKDIRNLFVVKLHHKMARSLDILGSALKVIARTPNAPELDKFRWSASNLIDENKRQLVISLETPKEIRSQIPKMKY